MLTYYYPDSEGKSVALKPPYRLQIFLPDAMRNALRDIAHEERTSMQQLVAGWLLGKIRSYPRYESVSIESEPGVCP